MMVLDEYCQVYIGRSNNIKKQGELPTLNKAIEIASKAHEGQYDKVGESYILHPLRVMMFLKTNDEKIVGVLHDAIEDTEITSQDIIDAVKSVTRQNVSKQVQENYWDFIRRVKLNAIGQKVKRADLKDNMDWNRIKEPTE